MTLSPDLRAILVCPRCHGDLDYRTEPAEELICGKCRLAYRVEDGIPIMLLDEARTLSEATP